MGVRTGNLDEDCNESEDGDWHENENVDGDQNRERDAMEMGAEQDWAGLSWAGLDWAGPRWPGWIGVAGSREQRLKRRLKELCSGNVCLL